MDVPMSSEYSKWLSTQPHTVKSLASKSQRFTLQEGLVLDLQVVQADLFGLQGMLSSIASSLRELEQLVSEQRSPQMEF